MKEFKKGDKIKCIYADGMAENKVQLKKGSVYIVHRVTVHHIYTTESTGDNWLHSRFELVTGEDALQKLIDRANDGVLAIDELYKNHQANIVSVYADKSPITTPYELFKFWGDKVASGYGSGSIRIVKKSDANLVEPFSLSKHKVTLKDGKVQVGCQEFDLRYLLAGLKSLIEFDAKEYNGFTATRSGVTYQSDKVSWADAELLYSKLKGLADV